MNNEMEQLLNEENLFKTIKVGQNVEGKVILEKYDEYYVDLNYKTDGVLPKSEVCEDEEIKVGDSINVKVIKMDRNSGDVIVSNKRAQEVKIWNELEKGQIIDVKVTDESKSGLIVSYKSIRGFIPLSHINTKYINNIDLKEYKNKIMSCEIIDIDSSKKRFVLSRKNLLIKEEEKKKLDFMENTKPGDLLEGTVKDIKDYGVFVDLDGFVGLVHNSELSWSRKHECEYKIGDLVKVKVISLDKENQRLALSIKALQKRPWDEFVENYNVGDIVSGKVKVVKDYGAFVKLNEIVDGFVHISNLSYEFVKNPKDVVKVDEDVNVKIINIDNENEKVELTMNINGEDENI
ncbi:30S ribosomal protein S1 [Tepidibacter aestuarii]|uniref:30S ribosomal protein S1 n=1 Tax=Tepidibacter aestuarii TaxID=2925782 RepID=UPI0020BE0B00|nr:S1 RNA-binding domain-containing protein [Tepidibacter aestuarii]CAH2213718.1 small subunit ribosomal protein S1 [Tepidibacter aestuarii]